MTASKRRTLALCDRLGRLTVADLMREEGFTMREAVAHLTSLVKAGELERGPFCKGSALIWTRKGITT